MCVIKLCVKAVWDKIMCVKDCVWPSCVCERLPVTKSYVEELCVCVWTVWCTRVKQLCVQELCAWGSCKIVMYESERVVCEKVACKRVVCVCVQELRVQKLCARKPPPKRRGGEQGGTFDGRKDVNWPASASVCAQQGALAHSPCCHIRLETGRKHTQPRQPAPPANEVTDDTTSVCLGTGTHAQWRKNSTVQGQSYHCAYQ